MELVDPAGFSEVIFIRLLKSQTEFRLPLPQIFNGR